MAQDPAALATKLGHAGAPGPFIGSLFNDAEQITQRSEASRPTLREMIASDFRHRMVRHLLVTKRIPGSPALRWLAALWIFHDQTAGAI